MAVRDLGHGAVLGVLSLLSLVTLVAAGPRPSPAGRMTWQSFPPADLKDFTSQDLRFTRTRQGNRWLVSYRFQGMSKEHAVSCSIDIQKAQNLIDEFSYRGSERASAIAAGIEEQARKELPRFIAYYGAPSFSATYNEKEERIYLTRRWHWNDDNILTGPEQKDTTDEFNLWYGKRKQRFFSRAEAKFMKSRGFLWDHRQGWMIDYARLVDRATPVLGDCIEEFGKEIAKSPELLMTFFQTMPWKKVEDKGTGWGTGGVRPPASVLLQWEGDCDSKAATFCVLHRRYSPGLFILRSSSHVLIGVEQYSSKPPPRWPVKELEATFYEKPVQVDNRYFMPCEVAGPGQTRYGEVALRKEGGKDIYREDYLVIPIPVGSI